MHFLFRHRELAVADVLVRVEPDLLEPDDPARDADLAVIRYRQPLRLVVEAFEGLDLRVLDGIRVVPAFDALDVRLALFVGETLHVEKPTVVHVDRFLVQRGKGCGEGDFADDLGVVADVDDHEVVAGHLTEADGVRRVGFRGPVPSPSGPMHHAGLLEETAEFARLVRSEPLALLDGQLECSALQVVDENLQVVRIDVGVLGRALEEVLRMLDDVLIERRRGRDEHADRGIAPAPGAARALPSGGEGTRVAGEHHGIERADVDAEFQCVGRNDAEDLSVPQLPLDFPPLSGQVAAAVPANGRFAARLPAERFLQVARENLRGQAVVGEDECLSTALQKRLRHASRFVDVAPPDAELLVHHRRVVEDEIPLSAGRAILVDQRELFFDKVLGEFQRIGDRCRAADDARLRTVERGDSLEPSQDVREMASEHAAIGVQFVDDDVSQVLEVPCPASVMRQDAGVQHVGIAQHHVGAATNCPSCVRRRVAVIRERPHVGAEGIAEGVEFLQLVHGQGLGREEVQGASRRIGGDRVENGKVVAERLAACRRRDDHRVFARGDAVPTPGLMDVELLDSLGG